MGWCNIDAMDPVFTQIPVDGSPGSYFDVIALESKQKTNKKFVIVPGNPGLVEFYIEFTRELFQQFKGENSVYTLSHLGHGGGETSTSSRVYSLEDQIMHKGAFLESSHFEPGSEFVLFGHSIGSFMALKVMHRFPHLNISYVVNMMPTFRDLWLGMKPFIKVAIFPFVRQTCAFLLHYLPPSLAKFVAYFAGPQEFDLVAVHQKKVDYYVALNGLSMGWEEAVQIKEIDNEIQAVFDNQKEKLAFIYSPSDNYTPKRFIQHTQSNFPSERVFVTDDSIPHAFVLTHSKEVAEYLHTMLEKLWSE